MINRILAVVGLIVCAQGLSQTIERIQVSGNARIERNVIVDRIGSKPGTQWDPELVAKDVKSIFQLQFFDDVSLKLEGGTLKVTVVERPQIKEIRFLGNSNIADDKLKEVIKVKAFDIYNFSKIQEDIRALTKHYEDKGFYLARIVPESEAIGSDNQNEVRLTYRIQESERVRIRRINLLGNKAKPDKALKRIMISSEASFFTGFSPSAAAFRDGALTEDLERLRWFYSIDGYVRFTHDPPTVQVSEDRRWVDITIAIEEGPQYFAGNIVFNGDELFTADQLKAATKLRKGDVFSQAVVREDIAALQDLYGDLGYAFANVLPRPLIDDEKRVVDLVYDIDRGEKVYFGKIIVTGNSKTRDKVVRRELRIVEGELYHGTRMKRSKENVERLGYFEQGVVFNTLSDPGRPQVLDVEIQVKERPTGTFMVSAGYGNLQGFVLGSNIRHNNFVGRGQSIEASSQLSLRKNGDRDFRLGFEEPFLLDTRWSAGVDVFQNRRTIPEFTSQSTGFTLSGGHPIAEYTRGFLSYEYEKTYLKSIFDPELQRRPELRQEEEGLSSSLTASLVRDTRSNRFEPRTGTYTRIFNTYAGLGGQRFYNQIGGSYAWFWTPWWDLTIRNRFEVGALQKVGGNPVPRSRLFRPAGFNALRGYDFDQVGGRIVDDQGVVRYIGGKYQAFTNLELEFPIIKEAGPLKGVVFYDAGNGYGYQPFAPRLFKEARQNWGFGIRWFSPIGPLRFEWAYPIGKNTAGLDKQFIFSIGPPF